MSGQALRRRQIYLALIETAEELVALAQAAHADVLVLEHRLDDAQDRLRTQVVAAVELLHAGCNIIRVTNEKVGALCSEVIPSTQAMNNPRHQQALKLPKTTLIHILTVAPREPAWRMAVGHMAGVGIGDDAFSKR